jgi:hypothetical protein
LFSRNESIVRGRAGKSLSGRYEHLPAITRSPAPATASTGSVLARFDTCRRAAVLIVCSLNTIPGRPRFIAVFEAAFAQQKSWPRFGFECDLSDIAA